MTPEKVWQEYPRPQMVRENWQNLNGLWRYAVLERPVPVIACSVSELKRSRYSTFSFLTMSLSYAWAQ